MRDDELLAQVDAAFAALDPVPAGVLSAGRSAIGMRIPGAVLAELTTEQDPASAGIRGEARLLTFACQQARVELEVLDGEDLLELAGQVHHPGPAKVIVRHPDGELTGSADRDGRFIVSQVPAGLVSLVFHWPDATSVVTSWIRL
jgi:hypothetical protein